MKKICKAVEKTTNAKFNTILINRYDSGKDNISWHSDTYTDWVEGSGVATLCFCRGSVREF